MPGPHHGYGHGHGHTGQGTKFDIKYCTRMSNWGSIYNINIIDYQINELCVICYINVNL